MATDYLVTLVYYTEDTHDEDAGEVTLCVKAEDWSTGSVAHRFAQNLADATGAQNCEVRPA